MPTAACQNSSLYTQSPEKVLWGRLMGNEGYQKFTKCVPRGPRPTKILARFIRTLPSRHTPLPLFNARTFAGHPSPLEASSLVDQSEGREGECVRSPVPIFSLKKTDEYEYDSWCAHATGWILIRMHPGGSPSTHPHACACGRFLPATCSSNHKVQ